MSGSQTHRALGSPQPPAPLPTPVLLGPPQSLAALAQPWFSSPGRAVQGPAHVWELGRSGPSSNGDMWGGQ